MGAASRARNRARVVREDDPGSSFSPIFEGSIAALCEETIAA
jgi:hypothetical protein